MRRKKTNSLEYITEGFKTTTEELTSEQTAVKSNITMHKNDAVFESLSQSFCGAINENFNIPNTEDDDYNPFIDTSAAPTSTEEEELKAKDEEIAQRIEQTPKHYKIEQDKITILSDDNNANIVIHQHDNEWYASVIVKDHKELNRHIHLHSKEQGIQTLFDHTLFINDPSLERPIRFFVGEEQLKQAMKK